MPSVLTTDVRAYVADHHAARPVKSFGNDISLVDAECFRAKVARELSKTLGLVIG